jgi:hypothetical protein
MKIAIPAPARTSRKQVKTILLTEFKNHFGIDGVVIDVTGMFDNLSNDVLDMIPRGKDYHTDGASATIRRILTSEDSPRIQNGKSNLFVVSHSTAIWLALQFPNIKYVK